MNTPIVSAEAKVRLQEAVRNYTPPAPEKYRALEEVKECLIELRSKKASYQTITTMVHDIAGIDVSHQTVARYCREVLESKSAKAARKTSGPRAAQPQAAHTSTDSQSSGQGELLTQAPAISPLQSSRTRGPHIADVRKRQP
jgi:hypothetical protein